MADDVDGLYDEIRVFTARIAAARVCGVDDSRAEAVLRLIGEFQSRLTEISPDSFDRLASDVRSSLAEVLLALKEDRDAFVRVRVSHGADEGQASNIARLSNIPTLAERLLSLVCTPDRLEVVLGDMEEGFAKLAARHGEKFARRWYWWQTARTMVAFGFQGLANVVAARELLKRLGL
jgi:hypothetical protein